MTQKRTEARAPEAIEFARSQRRNQNDFAATVWQMLKNRRCRGMKFRREHPIPPYTADFCCLELKLIIEVDGRHHETDAGQAHDRKRDEFLREQGYEVFRIPGYMALRNPSQVLKDIETLIDQQTNSQ